MKTVLLICNYFAPENEIASIRLVKFAKYLREYGYNVKVLVEKKSLDIKDLILEKDVEGIPVHYVENSKWLKKIDEAYSKITKKYREKNFADVTSRMKYNRKAGTVIFYTFEKLHPVLGTFEYLMRFIKQHNLFHNAKKYLTENQANVDLCFSTYGGYFGHFAGNYIKHLNPDIKWIADFSDAVYRFNFDPALFAPIAVLYEWWACLKCDEIVVVTKGMARRLPRYYRKKLHCITNGFDKEDKNYYERSKTGQFVISYTGRMYGGLQDVSVVFQVISELVREGFIDKNRLEFHYAGTGFSIFKGQAEKYHLGDRCRDFGFVPRKESLSIQAGSSILLLATEDYKCEVIGVLTGKVLEYMQQEKPVIAVINGDVSNNELACVIRETGLGFAYEESNHAQDLVQLKEYIKLQYGRYKDGQEMLLNLNRKKLAKYDYRFLTKKLIKLMEEEM